MAADLHIHVFTDELNEDDFCTFFSHTLGSKYFSWNCSSHDQWMKVCHTIDNLPNIWIGEVSWLKADLFDDSETFIPDPVSRVSEIIGEDKPTITEELIQKIEDAMKLENRTTYGIAKPETVVKFLRQHMGKKAFTVSW